MSKDPSVERELDRAIEIGLREQPRPAGCPSMDVMAAYCERTLAVDEVACWEEHFAGCRYCQQVLAAIARADPAVPPPAEAAPAWSRLFDWKWLVPATVAATAATVWIAVRPPSPSQAPASSAVQNRERAPLAAPALPPSAMPQPATPPAAAAEERFALKAPAPTDKPGPAARGAAPKGQADLKKEAGAPAKPGEFVDRLARRDAAPTAEAAGANATPPPGAVRQQAAGAAAEPKALANRAETVAVAASADASVRPGGTVIAAPSARAQWRVGSGGRVEHSRDGGATWEPQSSGTTHDLTTGAAVSDAVCWVVGRSGAILRTTDGQSWSVVQSPITSDIVGVVATDPSNAVVTTADKQRFTTTDGGKSWTRQEQ